MQLKLQLPGEKVVPLTTVWYELELEAQANLIRVLAKVLVKSVGTIQKETKEGEQTNDGEGENQLNAFSS